MSLDLPEKRLRLGRRERLCLEARPGRHMDQAGDVAKDQPLALRLGLGAVGRLAAEVTDPADADVPADLPDASAALMDGPASLGSRLVPDAGAGMVRLPSLSGSITERDGARNSGHGPLTGHGIP